MNYNNQNPPLPQSNSGLSGSVPNKRRWDDEIRWFDFPDRQIVTLRFFGPVFITYNHWLKTRQGKRFPLTCPGYDISTQNFVPGKCPICDDFHTPSILDLAKAANPNFNEEYDPNLKEIKSIKARIASVTQVIIRNVQNLGDPTLNSKPWHPVRLGPSVFFSLLRLKNMNVCTIQGKQYTADIADPYWGRDVHIMYNSVERNPQQKYMINLGEHTPLTETEKNYLNQLYTWENMVEYSNFNEMKQTAQINGYYQILNILTNGAPSFAQENNTQYAQYETFLKPPTPPISVGGYPGQNTMGGMPQGQQTLLNTPLQGYPMQGQPQQSQYPNMNQYPANNNMGMPQQQSIPVPSQSFNQQSQQPPLPQMYNQPPMASAPNMNGLYQVDTPQATPIPTTVAPPLGYNTTIPTSEGDLDIPFESPERTYPLKGQQVNKQTFDEAVKAFATTLPRCNPVQVNSSGELAGALVMACFGDYQGDVPCLKCPLRQYCVQV
jgi:hypothetical protein